MYVVITHHNGGHGEEAALVLITNDPKLAVATARDIESLGYSYYSNETGVIIFKVELDAIHPKADYRKESGTPVAYVRIYTRDHGWREGWHDQELADTHGETLRHFYERPNPLT